MAMIKHNQVGAVNGLVISLVLAVLLLISAMAFGGWAYTSRQDYKQNSDAKAAVAAEAAKRKESAAKDIVFAEEVKNPLKTFTGPQAYGSLIVSFPKTWSGYVDTTGASSGAAIDGYFAPNVVPATANKDSVFALRVQVLSQPYASVLQTISGQQRENKVTVSAYALPKLPKVVGVKINGEVTQGKTSTMIVLPLRAQTLQISTDGTQYLDDFNKYILPNFSFSP